MDVDESEEEAKVRDASRFAGQVVQEKQDDTRGGAVDEVRQRSRELLQELVGNFSSTVLNVAKAPNWDQAKVAYRPRPTMVGAPATGMPHQPTSVTKPVHIPSPRAQRLLDLTSSFTFVGKQKNIPSIPFKDFTSAPFQEHLQQQQSLLVLYFRDEEAK